MTIHIRRRASERNLGRLLSKSRSWITIVIAAAALMGCVSAKLNTTQVTTFDIEVRVASDNTDKHPANVPFTVSATCQRGETLVGGGHRLISNDNRFQNLVVVEGNYPSNPTTWAVRVRNPDNQAYYNGDHDVVVMALAYCVTTPGLDLQTEISQRQMTIPKSPGVRTDIDVRCSKTSAAALSGGFLTTTLPVFQEPGGAVHQAYWPALLGTGIMASGPRPPDATHSAMGWHVEQRYTPADNLTAPHPDVTTTVFTICANAVLADQAYHIATATGELVKSMPELASKCDPEEFSVGGGYQYGPDAAVHQTPRPDPIGIAQVDGNLADSPPKFGGWIISGDSSGLVARVSALCVRIPII